MDELDAMNLTAVFVNVTDTTVGIHLRQKLDRLNRSATAAQVYTQTRDNFPTKKL